MKDLRSDLAMGMKRVAGFVLVLVLGLSLGVFGQAGVSGKKAEPPESPKSPGAPDPFASAVPYLVSISVADLDASVAWYQKNLGFAVQKRMDLPKFSLRIAFMELNGFRLELVEFKQSVSYEAIQQKFPAVDDRAKIQGFGKLAFKVADIEAASAKLKRNGAKFFREITEDKDDGVKWLIVSDNSGNWIQLFQPLP